ncbi:MAG: Asp-tRNA(Asn)/Glu-tRNA(Gln) amidotransferase subunit GatA [Planctomycetota bacterium]|nr:MAG: Asp-tRNA(Asn)/Glu-tRNA(Gln) amidotransferase subunit GatA [Planctomycetota bacterium]
MQPAELSAVELVQAVRQGDLTAERCTEAFLSRIESVDGRIHAFLKVDREGALRAAAAIDQKRRAGKPLGPLAGLPVAVKDALCTFDMPTTCASKMLANFRPPYDAEVVARLRAADAVIVGKTNMDEFAMGGSNENSAFGPVHNPWDLSRTPGGSSGGSAACVAADMTPVAIGSDTGGSIRQPAGLCGITGLKPTYGRVSRRGLVAFASSLDQIGPMARSAADCALVLETIAGHDAGDATSLKEPVPAYSTDLERPLAGVRIGRVPAHFGAGLDPEVAHGVEEAFAAFRAAGATIHDIDMPHAGAGVATYYVVAPCEASSNLARYDGAHYGHRAEPGRGHRAEPGRGHRAEIGGGHRAEPGRGHRAEIGGGHRAEIGGGHGSTGFSKDNGGFESALEEMYCRSRAEGFGPEVKRRIMLGTYALSAGYYDAYYAKALRVRRLIRQDYLDAFQKVDLIGGPVSATPAFKLGEKTGDPLAMYLVDLYTVCTNLAGVGGISFPCGFTKSGLPIGFQLQAPALAEPLLLRATDRYQHLTDWHRRRPALAAAPG